MEQITSLAFILAFGQIGAGLAVLGAGVTGIGQGAVAAAAVQSIARQPEARGTITSTMFIGLAMSETGSIYSLLIAIILLFANPLVGIYLAMM